MVGSVADNLIFIIFRQTFARNPITRGEAGRRSPTVPRETIASAATRRKSPKQTQPTIPQENRHGETATPRYGSAMVGGPQDHQ